MTHFDHFPTFVVFFKKKLSKGPPQGMHSAQGLAGRVKYFFIGIQTQSFFFENLSWFRGVGGYCGGGGGEDKKKKGKGVIFEGKAVALSGKKKGTNQ